MKNCKDEIWGDSECYEYMERMYFPFHKIDKFPGAIALWKKYTKKRSPKWVKSYYKNWHKK